MGRNFLRQDLHTNLRTCLRRVIDPLCCLLKVFFARLVNVAKLLRIAVHEREPGALHLHHDAMTAPEGVIRIRHDPFDFRHFSRFKRLGLREAVAELAPHGLASDQLLIAAHLNTRSVRCRVWIISGVNVDQFDHPIRVRACGGNLQAGGDRAGDGDVLVQHIGLIDQASGRDHAKR